MSNGICIIPAKAYSHRCPKKNTAPFAGKPMLAHAIETAKLSGLFSEVVVSTDSTMVADIATQYGAIVQMRLDTWNEYGTQELARCVLKKHGAHRERMACVLYATTPLVLKSDLRNALNSYNSHEDHFVMAVGGDPLRDAGAFYAGLVDDFLEQRPLIGSYTRLYVLPESRVCDINTPQDMRRAEMLYAAMRHAEHA